MEVASQHCTKQNKRHFYTVKIEKIFIHDSRVQHPVQSTWLTWLTELGGF